MIQLARGPRDSGEALPVVQAKKTYNVLRCERREKLEMKEAMYIRIK